MAVTTMDPTAFTAEVTKFYENAFGEAKKAYDKAYAEAQKNYETGATELKKLYDATYAEVLKLNENWLATAQETTAKALEFRNKNVAVATDLAAKMQEVMATETEAALKLTEAYVSQAQATTEKLQKMAASFTKVA